MRPREPLPATPPGSRCCSGLACFCAPLKLHPAGLSHHCLCSDARAVTSVAALSGPQMPQSLRS